MQPPTALVRFGEIRAQRSDRQPLFFNCLPRALEIFVRPRRNRDAGAFSRECPRRCESNAFASTVMNTTFPARPRCIARALKRKEYSFRPPGPAYRRNSRRV